MTLFPRVMVLLLFFVEPGFAWAPEGHQIAAGIALRELTPKARQQVALLLSGANKLVLDSSWADEIREQRPDTSAWHYVNVPVTARGYDAARDCAHDDCVVAQILRDEKILSDPRAPRDAKAEGLRFLIHFIADVHQPLHVADRDDRGGNDLLVRMGSKRASLHQLWDQDVVVAMGIDSERIADSIDRELSPAQKRQMGQGTPVDWANESLGVARRDIYASIPPGPRIRLPSDYARKESAVARLQLARAGIRLAAVLNTIFK